MKGLLKEAYEDRDSLRTARSSDKTSDRIRVIVADDHPLFLEGVVNSLRAAKDIVVVGQANNANGALQLAREHLPDLAILDVSMPGSGLHAARDIAMACPATRIMMLTVCDDEDNLMTALKAGASGYVLKGVGAHELIEVVRSVHSGEVYISPTLAARLLREMTKPRASNPLDDLTIREREVLQLVGMGLGNQEIGHRLSLSEKTVKRYMTNILAKLQVRTRVEAALLAHRAGLAQDGNH